MTALRFLTWLGAVPTVLAIGLLVAGTLFVLHRRAELLVWLGALAGTGITVEALKLIVRRVRPPTAMTALGDSQWSFPSGHAALATVTYGVLGYLAIRQARTTGTHVMVGVCVALLIAAIAWSRIALGMHYLTDVIGGVVTGGLWAALGIAVLTRGQWQSGDIRDMPKRTR